MLIRISDRVIKASGFDPARLLTLQTEILVVDGTITANRRAPALIAAICTLYHSARLDSVAISQELKISPQSVRQILARMAETAKRLESGEPLRRKTGRPPKPPKPAMSPSEKSEKTRIAALKRRRHGRRKRQKYRARMAL